jgi:hypothetical protein
MTSHDETMAVEMGARKKVEFEKGNERFEQRRGDK